VVGLSAEMMLVVSVFNERDAMEDMDDEGV